MQTEFNISELYGEAHHRWLKPAEVHFLLQNYEGQQLTVETPQNPPSGSLFLFNRRVLRFFRKDGHIWRKKRDGKTVGEAHERLKVGNVDTLNCYYAHGEQNPNFQRRSYWMLDPAWEHIVLVHYREVTEGRHTPGSTIIFSSDSTSQHSQNTSIHNAQNVYERDQNSSSSGGSIEEVSSRLAIDKFEMGRFGLTEQGRVNFGTSSGQEVNQAIRRLAEQLSLDDDDSIYFPEKLPPYPFQNESQDSRFMADGGEVSTYNMKQDSLSSAFLSQHSGDSEKLQDPNCVKETWKEMLEQCSTSTGFHSVQIDSLEDDTPQFLTGGKYSSDASKQFNRQLSATRKFLLDSDDVIDPPISSRFIEEVEKPLSSTYTSEASTHDSGVLMLQKTNSIDWMENRINLFENSNQKSSPNFYDMCSDNERHLESAIMPDSGLTIAEVQRFSIHDISPEWAYSTERMKVVIVGDFLCNSSTSSWSCMFGDIEVPVEIVQNGVLRCYAPQHSAGKVNLCITTGNREACSEVREFEFRSKGETLPTESSSPQRHSSKSKDELVLLSRFAEILLLGTDTVPVQKENCMESGGDVSKCLKMANNSWEDIIEALINGIRSPFYAVLWVVEELLKDKLHHFLLAKFQQSGDLTGYAMSKQEQGMIHLIAALGYDWALIPILKAGVGVNFRDVNGWTALHWAARYGREKMVAALIANGASAGAVTDPTSQDPIGKNPASIAAECGHKGLAGYLSEVALTAHLSSLTLEESEISKDSAALEAERTVEIISDESKQVIDSATEDQLSLKDSLAAVRNVAQAAARIQAAFRAHSFRRRQQTTALSCDEYGMTPDGFSAVSKFRKAIRNLPDHKLNRAALSIQKNYRGWKRRKEYLNLRRNVVKIQAHFRGHQVRKKYKEIIWTVGFVEKAILRWRRKGVGLRGFRPESEAIDENEDDDDILKVFRKQKVDATLEEAVSRVLSMVESPEARQQYRRMLETYQQAKAELADNPSEMASSSLAHGNRMDDEDIYTFI